MSGADGVSWDAAVRRVWRSVRGVPDHLRRLASGNDGVDLTTGGIVGPLLVLSTPIVVTNLFQTAYNLADTLWLGRFSTAALAAISFSFPLVFLLIALGMGVSVAGSILVAQHTGAGNRAAATHAASQTVTFAVVVSTVLGAIGVFAVGPVIAFLGASPAVLPLATAYMRIVALGLPFMFGFFVFISLMRGAGDTVTPMLVMGATVALNVVIDPFLIFGWGPAPRLGVAGAAVATVFSRGIATIVGLGIMLRGDHGVQVRVADLRPDPATARELARLGVPASIEGVSRALSVNAFLFIVALFATPVVAAYGIGARVLSVVFLPTVAIGHGVETMCGQNVGANEFDRAAETGRVAAIGLFLVLTALGAVTWVFARPIVSIFTADSAVIDAGVTFLQFLAPSFGFMGIMRAYNGGFRGAGRTLTAAVLVVITLWALRLPMALLGAQTLGVVGVWLSITASNVLGAALAYGWFRRGMWRDAGHPDRGPIAAIADD